MRRTETIDLKDVTPHSVILADGSTATVRQSPPGHLIVQVGRYEIASASIVNGKAVNLRVRDDCAFKGIGSLIERSVKRAYGGGLR